MFKAKVGITSYQEVEVELSDELKPLFNWVDEHSYEDGAPDWVENLYTALDSEWMRLEKELGQVYPYAEVVNMITSSGNLVCEA